VTFILTGSIRLNPFRIQTHIVRDSGRVTHRIQIDTDPAVPPSMITNAYKDARQQIAKAMKFGGRFIRGLSEKHLTVIEWLDRRPQKESWSKKRKAWNRAYPEWSYSRDQNFQRDANSARERLLGKRNPLIQQ